MRGEGESQERRNQRSHPTYARPELLATAPNQLWSWDITWMRGPVRLSYFYFYVVLDVFSRYRVPPGRGWMMAEEESAPLATHLIAESCRKQEIQPGEQTVPSYVPTACVDSEGFCAFGEVAPDNWLEYDGTQLFNREMSLRIYLSLTSR